MAAAACVSADVFKLEIVLILWLLWLMLFDFFYLCLFRQICLMLAANLLLEVI